MTNHKQGMNFCMKAIKQGAVRSAMFLLALVLTLGFTVPMTFMNADNVYADATVDSWDDLKDKIINGGTQTITLSADFAYHGTSIELPADVTVTIKGSTDGHTIYSSAQKSYEPMFKVPSGAELIIDEGVTLSGELLDGENATCPVTNGDNPTYTAEKFTGEYADGANTYTPKGFFIDVAEEGSATLNGTLANFNTSRDKATTPRYVAPVSASGSNAEFNLGSTGIIKNNLVGYIADDEKAYTNAQTIKQYVKGMPPNSLRKPSAYDQKQNSSKYQRPRSGNAGIDGGSPGSGITGTAGAVIYKDGAKGDILGSIDNNRGDTGGIMASGEKTSVHIKDKAAITRNVGVQFGGGSTTEQGAQIVMHSGSIQQNVAWFGGGGVYATENGIDWLLGYLTESDGTPKFDARKDGRFVMGGGSLEDNTAFTRGGGILVDSDGVSVTAGELKGNMSWMLGGAVYVMGDHPLFTYTMHLDPVYIHDNTAVSGLDAARQQAAGKGDLPKSKEVLDGLNNKLQRKLKEPSGCSDLGDDKDLFDGTGTIKDNSDDSVDGKGCDGTGGGVWLCPFGSVLFDAAKTSNVVIDKNYATGTISANNQDAKYNSNQSTTSHSGISGGSDLHTDKGKQGGGVTITGLVDSEQQSTGWKNENTNEAYITETSSERTNLVSTREIGDDDVPNKYREGHKYVEVTGNISRRGGGLASDGKFFFGEIKSTANVNANLKLTKKWAPSAEKEPIAIRVIAEKDETKITVADVPLDGIANDPATEFDTTSELPPNVNTWTGKVDLPYKVAEGGNSIQLYRLWYTKDGTDTEIELDTVTGREELGKLIKEGDEGDIKVIPAEGVTISFKEMNVKKDDDGNWVADETEHTNHIFTPGSIDFSNLKLVKEKANEVTEEYIKDDGTVDKRPAYGTYTAGLAMELESDNDNEAIVEKYVNNKVHDSLVSFEDVITYDIMAYVPLKAKEFTITDKLVPGLEFADKDGNPVKSDNARDTVEKINVKPINDHKPEGTVSNGGMPESEGNMIDLKKGNAEIQIDGSNLTISINENTTYPGWNGLGKNALNELKGRWVQVTFYARVKEKYRDIEALKELNPRTWLEADEDKFSEQRHTLTLANGDLVMADALFSQHKLGPDPIIWAVEGPSRLFAKTASGDYYATPMSDNKQGQTWEGPLVEGSADWKNANNRYTGTSPESNNTKRTLKPDSDDAKLVEVLKNKPKVKGSTLGKGAEGQSRFFIEVYNPAAISDDNKNGYEIYATTLEDNKAGVQWEKLTPDTEAYKNAVGRLSNDKYTLRMLDFESKGSTLSGDGKNWPVISEEEHSGVANQTKYKVRFGNNAESTYISNIVTVDVPVEVQAKKVWENVTMDEMPSAEDFKSMLVLKNSKGQDVSSDYIKNLQVTVKGRVYTAKWTNLPNDTYTVDERNIPGFEKSVSGSVITNTKKPNEEKPEIEKYVGQAVHKDIKLKDVFTYDIIAYVTKDADTVTITDTLNDMLTFAGTASDVKVSDLGTADNHLVTNNVKGVKVNKKATVSLPGTPINGAQVTISGKTLKVFITNKLKEIKPEDPVYTPVKIKTIDPSAKDYYEKDGDEYIETNDETPIPGKTYYEKSPGEDTFTEVTIETVDPSAKGYYEKNGDSYTATRDKAADPSKTYYVKEAADQNQAGYAYDGSDQPVTALRGHWIRVRFNAKIDGKTLEEVKKAYQTIDPNHVFDSRDPDNKGNAPVISVEKHTGIPNNAGYTIGVANEAGIQEDVHKDSSNIVTVKPKVVKKKKDNSSDGGSNKSNMDDEGSGDNNRKTAEGNTKHVHQKKAGSSAKTGDDAPLELLYAELLLSGLALAAIAVRSRRRPGSFD